jgi:hypothetical protein
MVPHTVVLVIVALFSVPLIALYNDLSRRTNAAHLEVLQASDAMRKIDRMPWKRLERSQFLLGTSFVSMLAVMFSMRFIAGDSWSGTDVVSFWTVALVLTGFVVLSEHYKLEDEIVSRGGGQRAASALYWTQG